MLDLVAVLWLPATIALFATTFVLALGMSTPADVRRSAGELDWTGE